MKKNILTALLLMLSVAMSAATYYCKPDGKGDGSSKEQAGEFTSLVKNLKAGDILYCLGGQYDYSSSISISCSGAKDNFVNIWAAEGETPIFDFRNVNYGSRGISTSGNYVYMKGLTIRYSGKNGLLNSGSYCKFELLDVYGNGDTGVQMKGGGGNLILNCDSHDNFDYELSGISAADFGGNADGFADKQYTGGGNTYRGCRAWNNSDDGWDFYQHVTGSYGPTIIEDCICYSNGPGEYNMIGHARYNKDKSWFDQFKGEGIDVTDNDGNYPCRVSLEHYINWGNANGFKLGGGKTKHNVIVRNCISVMNGKTCTQGESKGAKAFDQNNNGGEMWVYNNTAYDNPRNYGFSQTECGTGHFYNNVSYKGDMEDVFTCPVVDQQNNDWNITGLTVSDADFQSLDVEAYVLASRNADGSLPDTPLLKLTEGSQLIDKGTTNTGLTFYGAAPDLGAYEVVKGEPHEAITMDVDGSLIQTVKANRNISTVKVTVGGGASAIKLKENVSIPGVTINVSGKQATISGTPTTPGTYSVELVPVVDYETTMSVVFMLTVNDASAVTIGYITTGNGTDAADKKIIEAISSAFAIEFFDATNSSNNYSECDALVISPVPSSGAAGVKALNNGNKPTLLLKPWMMKSGVWGWGTAVNTTDLSISVGDASHAIFTDVDVVDGKVKMFTKCTNNAAVTAISQKSSWSDATELASPLSASSNVSVADLTGANLNGTKINSRYIMIGISEYSTADLTADAQKLILNSVYYILNKDIPTAIANVSERENGKGVVLYDLMGRRVSAANARGTYIVKEGRKNIKLMYKQ